MGFSPDQLTAEISTGVLYFSLASFYILSYPAAQAISPSLAILLFTGQSASGKVSRENIIVYFREKKLVSERCQDLINTRLVQERGGILTLTLPSRMLIGFFTAFRKLLGHPLKGG